MKLRNLLPLCALALPFCASAVPAWPGQLTRTLPDGSEVQVRLHGDEFFSFMTDDNGFLLTPSASGFVSYKQDPNGARMQATPAVLESLRMDEYTSLTPEMQRMAQGGGISRIAQHDYAGQTVFPTTGEQHFCVILIQFADVKWSVADPVNTMNDMLNGDNYNYMGCKGSMRQYFMENSNGQFKPTFDIYGVYTLPNTSIFYTGGHKYDNIKPALSSVIQMANEDIDFSKYDIDGDGNIDNVIFFYAGFGQADTGDSNYIWPHNSSANSTNVVVDGKRFGAYCCFNELNGGLHYDGSTIIDSATGKPRERTHEEKMRDGVRNGMGTPLHEFGHVMGFPDLYDPNYIVFTTPGPWSLFDSGCYKSDGYVPVGLSAYERYVFKWITFEDLTTPGSYSVASQQSFGQPLRLRVGKGDKVSPSEYFLFETRDNSGWDEGLPNNGLVIWHIDYDRSTFLSNDVNVNINRPRCHIISADGSANYDLGDTKNSNLAAWPLGTLNYVTPDTRINLKANYLYAKGPQNHFFTNIAYDAATGTSTFDFDKVTESPTQTTLMHTPMREGETGTKARTVTFSWDPVDGADAYQFTLYYLNSRGQIYYEKGYEDRNIGNVTEFTYLIPSNKANQKFFAYVRPVVNSLPSLNKSNEVEFVTSSLAGVENVESGMPVVTGLKGAIDAPASARVFTMTGAPAGRTDLAPGIYIVVCEGKSYKVIVK